MMKLQISDIYTDAVYIVYQVWHMIYEHSLFVYATWQTGIIDHIPDVC